MNPVTTLTDVSFVSLFHYIHSSCSGCAARMDHIAGPSVVEVDQVPTPSKTSRLYSFGPLPANVVVTGAAPFWHTQPPAAAALVTGGLVQCGLGVQPAALVVELAAASAETRTALTKTGIIDPVLKLNGRCPSTLKILAISPEWLVTETYVASALSAKT